MTKTHLRHMTLRYSRRTMVSVIILACIVSTGCTTNYLTNSTNGTYGVPVTERTIPQRLLDQSIEHTAKINIYSLQENLQQNSRMSIDSFNSEVLLTGEVPTDELKAQIERVVSSMPDVRQVYNELDVSVARGYSSTVQDGYITSKLLAKVVASDSVKSSQVKMTTNNGVVYIMGRLTPTQQSSLVDIANSTAGVTEMVLLTTLVNATGATINSDDIMSEPNLAAANSTAANSTFTTMPATATIRTSTSTPTPAVIQAPLAIDSNTTDMAAPATPSATSTSPYIKLYRER